MTTPPGPPAVPKALGRYEIRSEIGRGAMGVVYKAEDPAPSGGGSLSRSSTRPSPVGEDEQRILEQRFRRDQTRLLVVKVGGNISLEWKS